MFSKKLKKSDINSWLFAKIDNHLKYRNIDIIYKLFEDYKHLIKSLQLELNEGKPIWEHFLLFVCMYSMPQFPIHSNKPFRKTHSLNIFDDFGTFYGEQFIRFITDNREHYYNHGIDILQKYKQKSPYEFIVLSCKLTN